MTGAVIVIAMLAVGVPGAGAGSADRDAESASAALYNGRVIDLSESWEGAGACLVWDQLAMNECFDTEEELEARVAGLGGFQQQALSAPIGGGGGAAAASSGCSSYLRLYDYTYYGGSSLWLATRQVWLNLSSYGWNQRASSFKVGACSSFFADYSGGGGAWYPTHLTQAYDVAATMLSGWNNDVSSVYIT